MGEEVKRLRRDAEPHGPDAAFQERSRVYAKPITIPG